MKPKLSSRDAALEQSLTGSHNNERLWRFSYPGCNQLLAEFYRRNVERPRRVRPGKFLGPTRLRRDALINPLLQRRGLR